MKHSLFSSFHTFYPHSGVGPSLFSRFLFGAPMGAASVGGPATGGVEAARPGGSWNGDHNLSMGALYFTLENYIIPDVARQYSSLGWTAEQIRQEGVRRVGELSRINLKYYEAEMDRKSTMDVQWEIVEKDGEQQLLASDYGMTLQELWQHTREYAEKEGKPQAYDPSEERAQLAMEKRIISGDISTDVFALSHREGVRYIQKWEKNNDGKFTSTSIDIGLVTGRNLTPSEAKELIDLIKEKYAQNDVTPGDLEYPHLMLKNGLVDVEDITTLARAQVMFPKGEQIATDTVDTLSYAAHQAANEFITSMQDVREYIMNDTNVQMEDAQERDQFQVGDLFQDEEKIQALLAVDIPTLENLSNDEAIEVWKEKMEEVFHLLPEQSIQVLIDLEETHEDMVFMKDAIAFVADSEMNIHAGVYALNAFVEPLVAEGKPEESIFSSEEEKNVVFSLFVQGDSIGKKLEETRNSDVEHIVILHPTIDQRALKKLIELIHVLDAAPTEQREHIVAQEKKHIDISILSLWILVKDMAGSDFYQDKPEGATIHSPSEFVSVNTREAIEKDEQSLKEFQFAVGILFLLKLFQYRASLDVLALFLQSEQQEQTSDIAPEALSMRIQKEKPEGLIQKESAPWILYAIIWYLAMIREQGKATSNTTAAKKKKKSKNIAISGASGVIFAFNS
jgi:hypothetical protein